VQRQGAVDQPSCVAGRGSGVEQAAQLVAVEVLGDLRRVGEDVRQ
jgi:hypothetical protein